MNIGAVGYSTDFYRAGYRKNSSNDSVSKFTTMGSATQETTSSNNGKTIGVTTAGNTGLLAKYADSDSVCCLTFLCHFLQVVLMICAKCLY